MKNKNKCFANNNYGSLLGGYYDKRGHDCYFALSGTFFGAT